MITQVDNIYSFAYSLILPINLKQMLRSSTYLYTVVAFLVNDGNVAPTHFQYNVDHRFDLIVIARYGTGEIFEALFV